MRPREDRSPSRLRSTLIALLALLAGAALTLAPQPPARAQSIVLDPTNLVQNIIAAIQNITEVAQQVQQLTNEATQITNQIQQPAGAGDDDLGASFQGLQLRPLADAGHRASHDEHAGRCGVRDQRIAQSLL